MIALKIGSAVPMLPLLIFLFLLAVRHIAQTLITMRIKREGQKTDISGTITLAVCYIAVMVTTIIELYNMRDFPFHYITGLIIMESFVILRMNALLKLGEFFSYEIRIAGDHKLIREGIYGIIRHPLHLAFWGEVLGMAVIGNNPVGYLVSIILFIVIINRNHVEDKILEDKFGGEFREYKDQVPSMNFLSGLWKRFSDRSPAKAGVILGKSRRNVTGAGENDGKGNRDAAGTDKEDR